jgi:hypothetical protein
LKSHTVDKGVQDGHGTVGNTSVGVNLLQHLVDVGRVGLLPGLGALLLLTAGSGGLLASILTKQKKIVSKKMYLKITMKYD